MATMQPLLDYVARWHDAWEVVGAVATAVAVVVALVGIWFEAAARRRAEKRAEQAEATRDAERQRADDERARLAKAQEWRDQHAQALQVIAWVQKVPIGKPFIGSGSEVYVDTENELSWVNASPSPVFDVVLDVIQTPNTRSVVSEVPVIVGGDRGSTLLPGDLADASELRARIMFRDLAGRHWIRQQNGELWETDEFRQQISAMHKGSVEPPSPG